jgi:hypothetical protein
MFKERDARRVTFQEDYKAGTKIGTGTSPENPRVPSKIFKKGTVMAMHVKTAEKLQERGAKIKVEKFDWLALKEKKKAAFTKRRKAELQAA